MARLTCNANHREGILKSTFNMAEIGWHHELCTRLHLAPMDHSSQFFTRTPTGDVMTDRPPESLTLASIVYLPSGTVALFHPPIQP